MQLLCKLWRVQFDLYTSNLYKYSSCLRLSPPSPTQTKQNNRTIHLLLGLFGRVQKNQWFPLVPTDRAQRTKKNQEEWYKVLWWFYDGSFLTRYDRENIACKMDQ